MTFIVSDDSQRISNTVYRYHAWGRGMNLISIRSVLMRNADCCEPTLSLKLMAVSMQLVNHVTPGDLAALVLPGQPVPTP